jgi:hypothetical protein
MNVILKEFGRRRSYVFQPVYRDLSRMSVTDIFNSDIRTF